MRQITRTVQSNAVVTQIRSLPQSLARFAATQSRQKPRSEQKPFDFGPISRAEMQAIIAEMIG